VLSSQVDMKVEVEHKEDIAILTAAMLRESLVLRIGTDQLTTVTVLRSALMLPQRTLRIEASFTNITSYQPLLK
jgi:hypothetical protein